MTLKDSTSDLKLSTSIKVDEFNYVVFTTPETMECFGCEAKGHLFQSCPEEWGKTAMAL